MPVGTHLLAVGIGMLSWLVAVVVVATLLLGGMLLLNALGQRYWPQDIRQALDSVPPTPAAAAAVPVAQESNGAVVGRE